MSSRRVFAVTHRLSHAPRAPPPDDDDVSSQGGMGAGGSLALGLYCYCTPGRDGDGSGLVVSRVAVPCLVEGVGH